MPNQKANNKNWKQAKIEPANKPVKAHVQINTNPWTGKQVTEEYYIADDSSEEITNEEVVERLKEMNKAIEKQLCGTNDSEGGTKHAGKPKSNHYYDVKKSEKTK